MDNIKALAAGGLSWLTALRRSGRNPVNPVSRLMPQENLLGSQSRTDGRNASVITSRIFRISKKN